MRRPRGGPGALTPLWGPGASRGDRRRGRSFARPPRDTTRLADRPHAAGQPGSRSSSRKPPARTGSRSPARSSRRSSTGRPPASARTLARPSTRGVTPANGAICWAMRMARRSGRRWGLAAFRPVGDMAIDLGTANTVIYVRGRGVVLSEPSVVAIDQRTGEVHAVGADAQRMIGRTPATISADRPLRHGVIADFEVTEAMLRQFMGKVLHSRFSHPRVVMCAPSGITEVERRAVEEASLSAGARDVHLIEESLAAAIGAGLAIAEPIGRMVVDIGGGTSEVAIISLGGIVVSHSLRVGGYDLDDAISAYIRTEHRMAIGTQSAEAIKLAVGSAMELETELTTTVRGRDLQSGLPRELTLTSQEVRAALRPPVEDIMAAVQATLEEAPPELAADITREGILMAGGGALLRGFSERIERDTGMPVRIADEPLACVAVGAGATLEEIDRVAFTSTR